MIKKDCIVEIPGGFIAKVVAIEADQVTLRWIGNAVHFKLPLSQLRYLGSDKGPSPPPLINFDTLILKRNAEAIEREVQKLSSRGRGKKPKELSITERLMAAQNDPELFARLLREGGLITNQTTEGEDADEGTEGYSEEG